MNIIFYLYLWKNTHSIWPWTADIWRHVFPSIIWLFGLQPSLRNFSSWSKSNVFLLERTRNRIPASPTSTVRKRTISVCDDEGAVSKSLGVVGIDEPANAVWDCKRFSATKIE
jgi:hypothetical protein